MGLFSNKAKPCPLCGGATPRLLPTKIQGEPLCSSCADSIDADHEVINIWTLDDVRTHIRSREENKKLVDAFTPTRTVDVGHDLVVDDNKRLFFVKQWTVPNPPVFRFDEIVGFDFYVGFQVVESWAPGMQRTPYQPPALGLASTLVLLADAFDKDDDDNRRRDSKSERIRVVLRLNNPYRKEYEILDISSYGSDVAEFEADFARDISKANTACNMLVSMAGGTVAAAGAVPQAAAAAAAPSADRTADDILKFKGLLDAGVITQAEFEAKKKQLLGL